MPTDLLPPIHPGEVLMEEFPGPMELSQYRLAKDIGHRRPIASHQ